jgi:hypothetical protein
MPRLSSAGAFLLLALLLAGCARDPLPEFPRVVLWAWESPQDLSFLDPREAGVAFLAKTVVIGGGTVRVVPRREPLKVPAGTVLMAVVRVQSSGGALPDAAEVATVIADAARLAGVRALQIDFDATVAERGFYHELIGLLKTRIPPGLPLTMTALASWCRYDTWIADLPVAEAVPMLFRMGPDRYKPGEKFRLTLCRSSIGISTDEPIIRLPRVRRVYIFHPGSWSKADYQNALREVKRWI